MSRATPTLLAALAVLVIACSKSDAAPAPTLDGHALFVTTCSRCHGAEGTGGLPLWEGGPSPRNFHDHAFHAQRTDGQLAETIKHGKGAGMPPFGGILNDAQVTALVAHVRSLDPEKGK
jgi:mono/diheme cytochrome c family protein